MDAERQEQGIDEAATPLERSQREMEHELDRLDGSIDEAKAAADRRPEAGSDGLGDVAGDWEDEATGSQQGEDAEDALSGEGSAEDESSAEDEG